MKEALLQRFKSSVSLTLIFIGIILLMCDYNFRWKEDQWKYAIHTDAANYYRYLPMVFIEHQFDDEAENPAVIKYFTGTAVMYSPFFAVACAGSKISGLPVDGYSMLFPILISIGTWFFFMSGLYFFSKFLRYYISKDWVICVTLLAITFGTVAFFYTVNAPGWAHIPAFMLVCIILYHLKRISYDLNTKSIIKVIAASSFLFFVRPTDIVILIIAPFLFESFSAFLAALKIILHNTKAVIAGLALAIIPLAAQLWVYKSYTDHFFVWSYSKEGFDFMHPEISNVLFSYAKGFFIYTPICFLALFGLFRLYKLSRYFCIGVVIYFILNIYIISSWWCWNYGYSYGPRAFVEHLPLFFLPLAVLLDSKNTILKTVVIVLLSFCIYLNLFQIYQAIRGILDPDFKTDKQGYWDVFLRTDKGYSGKFFRFPVDESQGNIKERRIFSNDLESIDSAWINTNTVSVEKVHSGKFSSKADSLQPFSIGIRKYLSEIPYNKNVLIRASGWFYVPERGSNSYFAISFVANGKSLNFNPFKLDGYTQHFGQWEYHVFEMYMPKFSERVEQDPSTQLELYYYNNSGMHCFIDDVKIEFIEFNKLDRILDLSWE